MFKKVNTQGSSVIVPLKKERLAPPPQMFEGRSPSVPVRHVDGFAGVFSAGESTLPRVVGLSNSEANRRLQKVHGENSSQLRSSTETTMINSVAGSERRDLRQPRMIISGAQNERTQWTRVEPVDPFVPGSTELVAKRTSGHEARGPAQASDTRLKEDASRNGDPLGHSVPSVDPMLVPVSEFADAMPSRDESATVPSQAWAKTNGHMAVPGKATLNSSDDSWELRGERNAGTAGVYVNEGHAHMRDDQTGALRGGAVGDKMIGVAFMEYVSCTRTQLEHARPRGDAQGTSSAVAAEYTASRVDDVAARSLRGVDSRRVSVKFDEYLSSRRQTRAFDTVSNTVSNRAMSHGKVDLVSDESAPLRSATSVATDVSAAPGVPVLRADNNAANQAPPQHNAVAPAVSSAVTSAARSNTIEPINEATSSLACAAMHGETSLVHDASHPLSSTETHFRQEPSVSGAVTQTGHEHKSRATNGSRAVGHAFIGSAVEYTKGEYELPSLNAVEFSVAGDTKKPNDVSNLGLEANRHMVVGPVCVA